MITKHWLTRNVVPVVLGVGLGVALIAPSVGAAVAATPAQRCGGSYNAIQAQFDIAHASDIWQKFPALGITPELQSDLSPAHVVVFQGTFDASAMVLPNADGAPSPVLTEVICVVQSDGTVNLYSNVSRQGSPYLP